MKQVRLLVHDEAEGRGDLPGGLHLCCGALPARGAGFSTFMNRALIFNARVGPTDSVTSQPPSASSKQPTELRHLQTKALRAQQHAGKHSDDPYATRGNAHRLCAVLHQVLWRRRNQGAI